LFNGQPTVRELTHHRMIAFTTLKARRPQVRIEICVAPHHAMLLRFPSVEDVALVLRLQGVEE
jgi:hypothetical protein